jgi:omega-amidase
MRFKLTFLRGATLAEAEHDETIVYAHIGTSSHELVVQPSDTVFTDPKPFTEARAGIPVTTQRRFDVYPDVSQKQ